MVKGIESILVTRKTKIIFDVRFDMCILNATVTMNVLFCKEKRLSI